jgi:hypothetical protein
MQYVIHGGLEPAYLHENLNIDIDDIIESLSDNIDILSKYTHIPPDTFEKGPEDNTIASKLFDSLGNFLRTISETRCKLCDINRQKIMDDFSDTVSSRFISFIDSLSTHSRVERADINSV